MSVRRSARQLAVPGAGAGQTASKFVLGAAPDAATEGAVPKDAAVRATRTRDATSHRSHLEMLIKSGPPQLPVSVRPPNQEPANTPGQRQAYSADRVPFVRRSPRRESDRHSEHQGRIKPHPERPAAPWLRAIPSPATFSSSALRLRREVAGHVEGNMSSRT